MLQSEWDPEALAAARKKWVSQAAANNQDPGVDPGVPGANVPPVSPWSGANPNITIPGSGYTPDYNALIRSDPGYLAYMNSAHADVASAAAARQAALRALVVRYGGVSGLRDQYGDVDQATLDLAGKNEYSDVRGIQRNYEQGVDAFKKSLAARGGISSGELGYGLGQADYARGQQEYTTGQAFASAAQEAINNYVETEAGARRGESGALAAAQSNVYANPANRPTAGQSAALDEGESTRAGHPVYRGPDGKLYNGDGSPYSAAPAPAPVGGGGGGGVATDNTNYDYYGGTVNPAVAPAGTYQDPTTGTWYSVPGYGGTSGADWLSGVYG